MTPLLANPDLLPFSIAAAVLVGLVLVEVVSTLLGASAAAALDHVLGWHAALHHGGPDTDPGPLDWLNVGRVPLLVLLMILLASFAVLGFLAGSVVLSLSLRLPGWVLAVPAFAVALPLTRVVSRGLGRLVPRDESYAIDAAHLVGRTAEVTVGPARAGVVARARVQDGFGNWHFPRIVPADAGAEIAVGTIVLIVGEREGVLSVTPAEGALAQDWPKAGTGRGSAATGDHDDSV